jgi:esterase/lipase superfamily enzyme
MEPDHQEVLVKHIAHTLCLAALIMLAACARDHGSLGFSDLNSKDMGNIERVFVATSRKPSKDRNLLFSGDRADVMHFADINVSVPLRRAPGDLKFPSQKADLKSEFAAVSAVLTDDEAEFSARLKAALAALPPQKRNIFVFVHGYNVSFAAGLFGHAQLRYDYKVPGVALHYSWPSAGKTALYLYDRDSAEFGRKGLARTLDIAAAANPKGIILLAHSMGTFVTMETLRTLSLQGENATLSKIEALILAAPDIDVDVFRTQLADYTKRPKVFAVLVSEQDRALQISSRVRGGHARVGSGANKDELARMGIVVLDLAEIRKKGDRLSHSTFANSPILISMVTGGQLNLAELQRIGQTENTNIVGAGLGAAGDLLSSIVYLPAKVAGSR